MRSLAGGDHLNGGLLARIAVLAVTSIVSFYLGRHWSDVSLPPILFSPSPITNSAISSNPSNLFSNGTLESPANSTTSPSKVGIIDADGTMRTDFEFDAHLGTDSDEQEAPRSEAGERKARISVAKFEVCADEMSEYIPCLDNEEAIRKLNSTARGERFERHCPREGKGLSCLVPTPKDYKKPIPWPQSRDEVWYYNVPHTRLVEDKGGQNWISRDKDKFKFPGGGTQFIHGADQYLDQISKMVPEIAFGIHTRVALDVGCGVASFGAYLLSRNVITLSIAPKDVYENQIQFALERGVPSMVAAFATHRLPYPSQAFDLIHCSRCHINWTHDDGVLLLEVNRLLRAGGYFVWAAQPVYKHEESQQEAWKEMEDLAARICWNLVKKEGYIATWQKPLNNSCYVSRDSAVNPPLCEAEDDLNNVWYRNLEECISQLPQNGYGANITPWPSRLHEPPQRLQEVEMDAYMAKNELFKAESEFWNDIVDGYIRIYHLKGLKLRNIMDMRAGFGGFAAALINQQIDAWVMNVVPVSEPNTLPVIYDRGLIGVAHDWCEPFDTYPRTYDMLHAFDLFPMVQRRCNISSILLEMDRILRPGGFAYIRDSKFVMDEILEIAEAMGWHNDLRDTAEGPYASRKVLMARKPMPPH